MRRRLVAASLAALLAAALLPMAAQGAVGRAKVSLPSAGSVNVAYFLVQGPRPAPGKKAKFPKLAAVNAPDGIVATWKLKRVAKSKDRFHLLVVSVRRSAVVPSRVAGRASAGTLTVSLGEGYRVVRRAGAASIEGACRGSAAGRVSAEQCNAPSVTGETGLFTLLSGDTLPQGGWSYGLYYNNWDALYELGEDLFLDRMADVGVAEDLDVDLIQAAIKAFSGRSDELVFTTQWTIPDLNGLQLDFGDLIPTNFLAPPGAACTPLGHQLTCIWPGGVPASPQVLNVRFSTSVADLDGTIRGTTDQGTGWSGTYPLHGEYGSGGSY